MKSIIFFIFCYFLFYGQLIAQTTFKKTNSKSIKINTVHPNDIKIDFEPSVINIEMPNPLGDFDKERLNNVKQIINDLYPKKYLTGTKNAKNPGGITKGTNFGTNNVIILPNGDTIIQVLNGGTPNDNTLAIANNGYLLTAFNSKLYSYDTEGDSMIMAPISLHAFSTEFTNNDKYDPKLIYDPSNDRFILVFLNGRASGENIIVVAFSSSNNPADPWYLFGLNGTPFGGTEWFDYPALSISKDELFITGNLLRDGEPWQTGFAQTIIYQVDLQDGYTNQDSLNTVIWSDIRHNGINIRNLHPVIGGTDSYGPNMYFLSNRNFAIDNDSIFLVETTGNLADVNAQLNVSLGITDVKYSVPPNAMQANGEELATNDARVLGAFIHNNNIQYVFNTVNPTSGLATVYHGFIENTNSSPVYTGTILNKDSLEFGYPNIAYSGDGTPTSQQSVIFFNHASIYKNPGNSSILYNSNQTYSDYLILKEGESDINRLSGTERWGDYSGTQRKYNDIGTVWGAGYYGRGGSTNSTWVSEIKTGSDLGLDLKPLNKNTRINMETYPNPFVNTVIVDFNIKSSNKITFRLYGIKGNLVKVLFSDKIKAGKNQFSFSTKSLTPGVYILNISDQNGLIESKKIIKN